MKSIRQKVFELVRKYLKDKKEGANYSSIIKYLKNQLPDVREDTLHRSVWDLRQRIVSGKDKDIIIPSRGVYILSEYYSAYPPTKTEEKAKKIKEEDFYSLYAEYLINELEECTKAIPLGGNRFQDKWGTPDVIGVFKFSEADPIKPPLEIISAEIKLDTNQLITAFGQACSYKIFSHKVYLVIPEQAISDIPRLESLCMRFGIGLIIFDSENLEQPNFKIRTRAIKSEPDYYYVNQYILKLNSEERRKLLG